MRIIVELVAARVIADEVRYLGAERDAPNGTDPDLAARAELARHFPGLCLGDVVLHSTSWRYEHDHIVLTHLAYSDHFEPDTLPNAFALDNVKDPESGPDSVAAHAVRHLAFLVGEDPAEYEKKLRPDTLAALKGVAPDVAGRHDLPGAAWLSARGAGARRTRAGQPS